MQAGTAVNKPTTRSAVGRPRRALGDITNKQQGSQGQGMGKNEINLKPSIQIAPSVNKKGKHVLCVSSVEFVELLEWSEFVINYIFVLLVTPDYKDCEVEYGYTTTDFGDLC